MNVSSSVVSIIARWEPHAAQNDWKRNCLRLLSMILGMTLMYFIIEKGRDLTKSSDNHP